MATIVESTDARAAPVQSCPTTSFVLYDVSWEFYEACLAEFGDRPTRINYDNGTLEFMSPTPKHDRSKTLLGRMIEALTEELDIPIRSYGSTTWRKKRVRKGLEPDEAYYVQHEPQVRGKEEDIDLTVDPPPDLAVEVEITETIVERIPIYAALGVGELWRYDGQKFSVLVLGDDHKYHPSDRSPAFPFLPLDAVGGFLARANETDETTWIRSFRAWVRQEVLPRWNEAKGS